MYNTFRRLISSSSTITVTIHKRHLYSGSVEHYKAIHVCSANSHLKLCHGSNFGFSFGFRLGLLGAASRRQHFHSSTVSVMPKRKRSTPLGGDGGLKENGEGHVGIILPVLSDTSQLSSPPSSLGSPGDEGNDAGGSGNDAINCYGNGDVAEEQQQQQQEEEIVQSNGKQRRPRRKAGASKVKMEETQEEERQDDEAGTIVKPEEEEIDVLEDGDGEFKGPATKGKKKKKASAGPKKKQGAVAATGKKGIKGEVGGVELDEGDLGKCKHNSDEPQERPPAANSDYIPIPWKGRLGYACLNTYLRYSNPPIFCSRTCRLDTILKQGENGKKFVEEIGLANARDLTKLIQWNERFGIKFLRISSEMFPFASHLEHGYNLDFAKDVLAEAGRWAMKYGHRITTHPGQFTQLGSPRDVVVKAAIRDIDYHCQMLGYLGLEGQADRDSVMVIHMGGVFGDPEATVERFKDNYTNLVSEQGKRRLVLENDDVCWNVHQLLPVCEELNIPLVLDWHHHNIVRDASMREGTLDILQFADRIKQTWTRKEITQKQHYSEPRDDAVTDRERRRHSARVRYLPPCEDTMDLMIEAKDKEQAVFDVMRKYKIEGWETIGDVVPHVREDENKPLPKPRAKKPKKAKAKGKGKKAAVEDVEGEDEAVVEEVPAEEEEERDEGNQVVIDQPLKVPEEEVGMGGPERRVYWPEGKEEWLSPEKRVRKPKMPVDDDGATNAIEASDSLVEPPLDEEEEVAKKVKEGKKRKVRKPKTEAVDNGATNGIEEEGMIVGPPPPLEDDGEGQQKGPRKRGGGGKKKNQPALEDSPEQHQQDDRELKPSPKKRARKSKASGTSTIAELPPPPLSREVEVMGETTEDNKTTSNNVAKPTKRKQKAGKKPEAEQGAPAESKPVRRSGRARKPIPKGTYDDDGDGRKEVSRSVEVEA